MDPKKNHAESISRYVRSLTKFAIAGAPSGAMVGGLVWIVYAVEARWNTLRFLWDAGETGALLQCVFGELTVVALGYAILGMIGGAMTHMIARKWSRAGRTYGLIVLWAVVLGFIDLVLLLTLNLDSGTYGVALSFGVGACFGALLGLFVRIAGWISDRYSAHKAKKLSRSQPC